MLENQSALAIVPKAKAIAARRLMRDDYAELERKRSVLEVTTALQNHPYFADSLKGLSPMNLHRAQIEEALRKDIFYKYNPWNGRNQFIYFNRTNSGNSSDR